MIPIEDIDGHVIAFGGRVMGPGEPKYMNSPESAVYTKGNNLFGLSKTREAIREKGFAVLVEGYFDLIALWNAGIKNVVATLGTALTRSQVDLIRRYSPNVAALFDPDEAGRKALARSLELFLAGNVHARAVILPEGQDPDDFVRAQGREEMEELLAHAWPMADYYIERILGGKGTLQEERDKLREAVAFLNRIEDDVERNLFGKKIAEALGVDHEILKKELRRTRVHAAAGPAGTQQREAAVELDSLELSLVRMMLEDPAKVAAIRESAILDHFRTTVLKSLGETILAAGRAGKTRLDASTLVDGVVEGPVREKLLALLVQESPYPGELIDRLIADTIRKIRERTNREKERTLTRRIAEAEKTKNGELRDRLVAEKNRLLEQKGRA
jgi:DNA primase